jgi:predicted outer membrane repeat protein
MNTRRVTVRLLALIVLCFGVTAAADAVTINHRSIGTNKGVILGSGSGSGSATATVAKDGATVTIEGGALPDNVGRGDEIVIDDEELYILSRDTETQLTLQRPAKGDHLAQEFAIRRAYTSIQAWVNDRNGNLVRENRLEVGVLYNDGPFTVKNHWILASISGSRTDAEHFMWLTAAEGARHKGVAGTGVVLDGRDRTRTGILIEDDYTRIDGIELKQFGNWLVPAAVTVRGAKGVVLERLIIHDFDARYHENYGIKGGVDSSFTVRNCIIYDGGAAGIIARRKTASVQVENCTVYGMRGRGVDEGLGSLTVVNTAAMGNTRGDFSVKRGAQSFNLSSDGTAAGEKSKTFLLPIEQFASVQKGLEDFHLLETSAAVDSGKNLSLNAVAVAKTGAVEDDLIGDSATVDVDGTDRAEETDWDIGADEVESAPANVWYVDAAQNGDGRSWKSAYGTIQQAIAAAAEGQEIWVKGGTYVLESGIMIQKPIALFGSFSGTERKKEKRDSAVQTVLDASPLKTAVNTNRSAISINAVNVIINGFVFSSGGILTTNGGAVNAWPGSIFTLENCRFEHNEAASGGGLYSNSATGVVINCLFRENAAKLSGGAIYSSSSALRVINCLIEGNTAGMNNKNIQGGGGIFVTGASAEIYNCTFYGNSTKTINSPGGGIYNFSGEALISNCIVFGNYAATGAQVHSWLAMVTEISNCDIDQDGFESGNGNIRLDPLWTAPGIGDFHLQPVSPCINKGSNDALSLPAVDYDGNPRLTGGIVDMGAFEYQN